LYTNDMRKTIRPFECTRIHNYVLFGCTHIHLNYCILEWIRVEYSLIHPNPLQHTWIEIDMSISKQAITSLGVLGGT
jgi:hypothetical protein